MKANVSISPVLFSKDNPNSVQECINNAKDTATEYLAHSDFIRSKHEEGNKNSSRESTVDGVLRSAATVTGVLASKSETGDEVFFGENLGEAVRTIKAFFKKK